jgi:hypothetical protein
LNRFHLRAKGALPIPPQSTGRSNRSRSGLRAVSARNALVSEASLSM